MRKELYEKVKALSLQNAIKMEYGKNYTQCSNSELESALKAISTKDVKTTKVPEKKTKTSNSDVPCTPSFEPCTSFAKPEMEIAKDASEKGSRLEKLVDFLFRKRILLKSELDAIMGKH